MKYYTKTIPIALAEKLKEKGMPMEEGGKSMIDWKVPSYAEVLDWFLDKHETFVYVTCLRMDEGWQYCGGIWGFGIDMTLGWKSSWHEAANAAIEKALTLI